LFGGAFRSEPLPFDVQDVSVITEEQFAALSAQRSAPEISDTPATLQPPEEPVDEVEAPEPVEETQPRPDPVAPTEPEPDAQPEVVEVPPEPEVIEEPPVLQEPEPEIAALPTPPGPTSETRPTDKVAPEPVTPPPPEVEIDDVETPPVSLDEGAETQQEQQDQTAPEAANDQIVTEAEEGQEIAPLRSPRPPARPQRPTPPVETEVAAQPAPDTPADDTEASDQSAINSALAEALSEEPSGPPLTLGEKDAMRVAVAKCWNVGSLSTDALQTVVVVGFSLNADGTVISNSLRLLESSGGAPGAERQAYDAARRAILRCGTKGYDLPADKYAQWQDIEITFNPERMRIK